MFVKYLNFGGHSNVLQYEIRPTSISVMFKGSNKIYTYSYLKAGQRHVEQMKFLAKRGMGLNSYINLQCKLLYD